MQNRRFFLAFGCLFLFIGLMLLVQGLTQYLELSRFRSEWINAQGVITRKWIVAATRTGPTESEYRVEYLFSTPANQRFTRTMELDPEEWEALAAGDPVTVLYPQSAPTKSRLPSEGEPPSGIGEGVAGLLASLFGGVMAAWNLARIREARPVQRPPLRLLQTLRTAAAWILRILAALLFIAFAESIPALKRLEESMALREPLYITLAILTILLGAAIFTWSHVRRTSIAFGAAIVILGFAAVFFAIGPAFVKAGVLVLILYAAVRFAIASRHA